MKILNISLDKKILDKNSAVAQRVIEYGKIVDKFTVLVIADDDKTIKLSDKVKIAAIKKTNKFLDWLRLKKGAENILQNNEYDIITVQDTYFLGFLALRLAKKFKMGLEMQVHGFEKFWGLRKTVAKYVLPKANAVRVVSQRLKRQLVQEFGVEEDKITIVPIYVDVAKFTGLLRPPTLATRGRGPRNDSIPFIFLTVGRLVPVKNIKMQIEALAEVIKKYPQTELWIVGNGPLKRLLEVKCSRWAGSNVKCHFFGWRDDLERFYQEVDVFLLTSNYEGWGMAVIEAASYGLPIIMTDVGCASEVIKDGKSGLVIPVGNQKKLTEAMVKLIQNKELRKRLGEEARQAIAQLPNKEETLELYKKSWEMALKNLPC